MWFLRVECFIQKLKDLRGGACGIIIAGPDSLSCDSNATWSDSFSGSFCRFLSAEIAFTTSTASSATEIYENEKNN